MSIAHNGTQEVLENPKDGMERLLFMDEPRWEAPTEKHELGTTLTRNLRIFGFLSLGGGQQALSVMVDVTVTAAQVLLGLTLGDGDTLRYCQGQRA